MSTTATRSPNPIATAPRSEWLKFTAICLTLGPASGSAFVFRTLEILNRCATRPTPADAAGLVALLVAFVFFTTAYIYARLERQGTPRPPRQQRQTPSHRAPWTPPWTTRQRRQEDATPATQARQKAHDKAKRATPDAATEDADAAPRQPRQTYTPAIDPDEQPDVKQGASLFARFTERTPKIESDRKKERKISIAVQEGSDQIAALAQEAAKRGWQAIRDTATGDLALFDPKHNRVYTAQFRSAKR